jgi:DNA-binding CsgD family transcriptional regulator
MKESIWHARIERVRECFDAGLSQSEAADYLQINPATIKTYIKRAGLVPPKSNINLPAVKECAARGMTRAETAEELGLSIYTVGKYGREHAIAFRHASAMVVDPRADDMASMYRSGRTLEEIGKLYGITRERVRQIITKRHGLRADDGGAHAKAKITSARAKALKDAKYLAKYGCTFDQWREMVAIGAQMRADGRGRYQAPTYAYVSQRTNARRRGIGWELSLLEWWQIWDASGKWGLRGRGRGYMMCRFGDVGPYALGNVYIATGVHNGLVQPNNPYRANHPEHAALMEERRAAA